MKKRIANVGFISVIVAFISVVAACSHAPNPPVDSASNNTVGLSQQAVAMPDSYSADAAMQVLQEGGNAIDAAITAQFVLAVTLPEAGNVGGGGFMTIKFEDNTDFLDYREMAPENAHRDMYLDEQGDVKPYESLFGAKASGIPGTVAGMWAAHKKYGTLDWERLLAPAVDLAEQGFVVHEKLANNIDHYIERTKEAAINNNFSEYFAHAKAGTTFKQPELAKTLKAIQQQGKDGFYKGDVAKHIVDFMQQNGGLITYEDLLAYKAVWRKPLHLNWQGYELVTAPPPSSGGVAVAQWIPGIADGILSESYLKSCIQQFRNPGQATAFRITIESALQVQAFGGHGQETQAGFLQQAEQPAAVMVVVRAHGTGMAGGDP